MAEPRLIRAAPAAASSAADGAPGPAITATGSGPAASAATAAGSARPGTKRLSAPASAYAADRATASPSCPDPVRNTSVRALIHSRRPAPSAAARACCSRPACSAGESRTPAWLSSMLTPTAPACSTADTVAARSSYPASMSADTGTSTAAAIRATAAAARSAPSPPPSGTPSDQATPALVVAIAFAPAAAIMTADATSHAFGSSNGSPGLCSAANSSACRACQPWACEYRACAFGIIITLGQSPTTSSWSSSVNSTIMLANCPAIRSR